MGTDWLAEAVNWAMKAVGGTLLSRGGVLTFLGWRTCPSSCSDPTSAPDNSTRVQSAEGMMYGGVVKLLLPPPRPTKAVQSCWCLHTCLCACAARAVVLPRGVLGGTGSAR